MELMRTECQCETCQGYCRHAAGWFRPGEAERAAALKGLSLQDFFARYLTVDYWAGTGGRFLLRPRTVAEPGGEVAGGDPRGQCVFYKDGKCDIHAAKPYECATATHDVAVPDGWHESTAIAWEPHQDQIRELLGREPQESGYSFLDMLSLLSAKL